MSGASVASALLSLSLLFAISGCGAPVPPREPPAWGEAVLPNTPVKAAVNRYFHYRRLAILSQDPEILWTRFPELRTGADRGAGINTEHWLTESVAAREALDLVYDLDRYARVQMWSIGSDVVVRVHGLERYIQKDFTDGTTGEFILDLSLKRDGEGWTVVKTDEVKLAELHDPANRP